MGFLPFPAPENNVRLPFSLTHMAGLGFLFWSSMRSSCGGGGIYLFLLEFCCRSILVFDLDELYVIGRRLASKILLYLLDRAGAVSLLKA